jgi:protein-tyrosine-phosphatase
MYYDGKKNDSEPASRKEALYISFICTGNTCRSYIAEAVATHLLKTVYFKRKPELKDKVIIGGAGTHVVFKKIPVNTFRVLDKLEIPNIKFHPDKIDNSIVKNSDLLITMATSHKNNIIARFRDFQTNKIFNLIELANVVLYLESEDIYKRKNQLKSDDGDKTGTGYMQANFNMTENDTVRTVLQRIDLIKNIRTDSLIKPQNIDIIDPFGRSAGTYLKVAKLIKENIMIIFNYLFK